MHDASLIATVAAAFTAAWVCGLATQRLGLSPIVGYLLGGILIGPYTPGFVGDVHLAQQLAEVGVILLMFGVGLHFHLHDLLAVKAVAIPGAIGQSLAATAVSIFLFAEFGFSMATGAVIGMAMSVASTVVLMRVLMDADILTSPQGHVAVGWLLVEDILTVLVLLMIPVLGGEQGAGAAVGSGVSNFWPTLGLAFVKLGVLVAIMALAGRRIVPWALVHVTRLRSRELFTLTVLVSSIAIAAASYFFFGASMALGAFLAGMVVAQSPVSHQAAADALPMRDAFAVLFFVSVGMLFEPAFLLEHPLMLLGALGVILIAKPLAALTIVGILGHSTQTALTVAIGLAQIGEFSFILSEAARRHGWMPDAGHNLLVASAIISITLNPMLFRQLPRLEAWLKSHPSIANLFNRGAKRRAAAANRAAAVALAHQNEAGARLAIVVGYGPVGRSVHRLLRDGGLSTVVVDLNLDTVTALMEEGQTAIFGDASHESILEQAGVQRASHLILTLPHSADRAAVVAKARALNRRAHILVRARYLREREDLEQAGATAAVFEEAEAAVALARLVLADTGVHREAAEGKIKDLRLQLLRENLSNIRSQRVRSVMVPWLRVHSLTASADTRSVLAKVAQERFSRWPVVDSATGRVAGYLLTKDLIAHAIDGDWSTLIRPLRSVRVDDVVESVLTRMQAESASLYLVEADGGQPAGLVTLEDLLEQVVGQIDDEYPHQARLSLREALENGALVPELKAGSGEQAIQELVAAIAIDRLPPRTETHQIVRLALQREQEISTDLGNGVALPHARLPGLASPMVILGRSREGLLFSPEATELVHLVFLLLTPAERPDTQLSLLSQVAALCAEGSKREALMRAATVLDILGVFDPHRRQST